MFPFFHVLRFFLQFSVFSFFLNCRVLPIFQLFTVCNGPRPHFFINKLLPQPSRPPAHHVILHVLFGSSFANVVLHRSTKKDRAMNESSGTSACRCSDEFEKTMADNPQCLHVVMIRLITAYEHHLDTLDCDEPKFFDCDDAIESHRHADGFGSADVLNWWTTVSAEEKMIRASVRAVWHTLEEEKRKEKDTRLSQTRDDNVKFVRQMEDLKHCIQELNEKAERAHQTHTAKIEAVHQGIAMLMEDTKDYKTSEVERRKKAIQAGNLSLEIKEVLGSWSSWVSYDFAKKLDKNEKRKCALFSEYDEQVLEIDALLVGAYEEAHTQCVELVDSMWHHFITVIIPARVTKVRNLLGEDLNNKNVYRCEKMFLDACGETQGLMNANMLDRIKTSLGEIQHKHCNKMAALREQRVAAIKQCEVDFELLRDEHRSRMAAYDNGIVACVQKAVALNACILLEGPMRSSVNP
jgi:hypothetical protein